MKILMKKKQIEEKISQIVEEILKEDLEDMVLIGIRTGGAFLAQRIKEKIKQRTGKELPIGILDITLYRDDWTRIAPAPVVKKTEIPFPVDEKTVILIDDVLFTGRTVRAAMDAILDYGRPKKIRLAVLIDRGKEQRELPICADYVGETVKILADETISVYFEEQGKEDIVIVEKRGER